MKQMMLRFYLPEGIFLETEVTKVKAESNAGQFILLPGHCDLIEMIPPSIFYYYSLDKKENYIAVDEGLLVKKGQNVNVAVKHAVKSDHLGNLKEKIVSLFTTLDENEKKAKNIITSLETEFVRKLILSGGK